MLKITENLRWHPEFAQEGELFLTDRQLHELRQVYSFEGVSFHQVHIDHVQRFDLDSIVSKD
jgi:hypothetical protein